MFRINDVSWDYRVYFHIQGGGWEQAPSQVQILHL